MRGSTSQSLSILRVVPGDALSAVESRLGPPTVRRGLDNNEPWSMGAQMVEYGFPDPVLTFEGETGAAGQPGQSVQFVVDPNGRILRLMRNPNAPGPEGLRTLRGPVSLAQAVRIPADATPLPPRDADVGDRMK
jgi:hypothetical protein